MTIPPSSSRRRILPYLSLTVVILALSLSAMFIRWAKAPGPVTSFYRYFIATLLLVPFFIHQTGKVHRLNRSNLIFPILGGFFSACDLALWSVSLFYTTASNATLLGNTAPFWVALAAWFLFREKLTRGFWLGLTLALSGAAVVMGSDFLLHPKFGLGDLLALGTGFFYAGYFLFTQQGRKSLDPISFIFPMAASASVTLFLINLILGNSLTGFPSQTWLVFIGGALVSQLLGYFSLIYTLGHLPASIVSPTMILQPVLTTILAVPLLGEVPRSYQLIGGAIVLAGIFLVHQAHNRSQGASSGKPLEE